MIGALFGIFLSVMEKIGGPFLNRVCCTYAYDAAGNVLQSYDYDVFGAPTVASPAIQSRFGFTGREYDPETGLYNYRARAYSPALGRFLQRDPIGFADDYNLYRYVKNDPVNFVDPHGLELERKMALYKVERPIPQLDFLGSPDATRHWGIQITDSSGQYSGTWDLNYDPSYWNLDRVYFNNDVPANAGPSNSSDWPIRNFVSSDPDYIRQVYQNIQNNSGSTYYNKSSHNCQDWVCNRLHLRDYQ